MGTAEHQRCVTRFYPPDRACDRSERRIADIAQSPQGNPGMIFRSFPEGQFGSFLLQLGDDSRITGLRVRRRGNATCATTPAGGRSRRSLVAWSWALRMPTSYRLWCSHASGGVRSPEEIPTCFFPLRGARAHAWSSVCSQALARPPAPAQGRSGKPGPVPHHQFQEAGADPRQRQGEQQQFGRREDMAELIEVGLR